MSRKALHDIGRVNNSTDASHGERSVEKAFFMGFDLDEPTDALIRYHSRGDQAARSLPSSLQRLLWILKDADALDRVRSGDLDVSFLRFPESSDLVGLAEDLWRATK